MVERAVGSVLTPEVLCQTKKQPHCLVVVVTRGAGGTQHQGFSPWSSGGPEDAIHVCAFHHLRGERMK